MKNARLCVAIVLMCIICPILIGYAMPADQVERTQYSVDSTSNISSGLYNSDIPAYSNYNDTFNNMFAFSVSYTNLSSMLLSETEETTTTVGGWPALGESTHQTVTLSGTTIDYEDLSSHIEQGAVFATYNGSGTAFFSNGEYTATGLAIFPTTQQMYLYNIGQVPNRVPVINVTGQTLTVTSTGPFDTTFGLDSYVQAEDSSGNPLYAVPSSGVQIPNTYSQGWSNTFVNGSIRVIVKCDESATLNFYRTSTDYDSLSISVSGGDLNVSMDGIDHNLGSTSVYPYVLVEYDSKNGMLNVSGLSGMTSFTDDYSDKIGNSTDYTIDEGSFYMFTIRGSGSYYVASASIQSGVTNAMKDVTLTPRDYYPDGAWALSFRGVAIYGDSITLTGNGRSIELDIQDGRVQANDALGIVGDLPVSGLVIQRVFNDYDGSPVVTLNGQAINMDVDSITFDGTWVPALYLSHLSASTYNEYSWLPGNFGLDQTGFCMAGIMTAFCMFLAVALYGRVSGEKTALALIVSAICGAVFIILM